MAHDLLTELKRAFQPRPLTPDLLADPTGVWDAYGESGSFAAALDGRSWDELGPTFVEDHFAALRYMTPEAFVAFVPAYLAGLLDAGSETQLPAFVFTQLKRREQWKEEFDSRAAHFDQFQRAMIVSVLESLERGERFSHYRSDISEALSSWRGE